MRQFTTSQEAYRNIRKLITKAFSDCLRPIPKLNLVEWADTYRHLPDNSAEPGLWKTSRVEPVREVMLAVTDPLVQEVTTMCCIQVMKTELMLNTALYYIHQEPSPLMYIAPKEKLAEAWSKERFMKSVKATPVTRDIFSENRRGEGNTILQKQYPGGQISIVSARNPDDLAMRACRILMFDEVDKYPLNVGSGEGGFGGEGDPIAVAWGRATTYGRRAKKLVACSPTVEGISRVENEYKNSSQGIYLQKCPHCEHEREIDWFTDVKIPVDQTSGEFLHEQAHIICHECGKPWSEGDRQYSIRNGRWHHQRPEVTWHRGFKLSSLSSPFTPVPMLALEFINATGNSNLLKAFYNTRLARTWREIGEQPDWKRLYERRESYPIGEVPEGGLMVTLAIDVQSKGIYYEYVAWGRNKENWSIDKGYEAGDIIEDRMQDFIHNLMRREFANELGVRLPVEKGVIDSGHRTQRVYNIVRNFMSDRLVAIKGDKAENLKTLIGTPTPVDVNSDGKRISRGLMMWPVGSSVGKEELYAWLNLNRPSDEDIAAGKSYPSGYCHFPEYDEEYFKQITSEQLVRTEDRRGYVAYAWEKLRKDNHFLDTRVYNRCAAAMLQIDRYDEKDWQARERLYTGKVDSDENNADTTTNNSNSTGGNQYRIRRKGWLKRG